MKQIILAVASSVLGNLLWFVGLTNLAWLLFKDTTLFSWWWVIGIGVSFVLALGLFLLSAYSTLSK